MLCLEVIPISLDVIEQFYCYNYCENLWCIKYLAKAKIHGYFWQKCYFIILDFTIFSNIAYFTVGMDIDFIIIVCASYSGIWWLCLGALACLSLSLCVMYMHHGDRSWSPRGDNPNPMCNTPFSSQSHNAAQHLCCKCTNKLYYTPKMFVNKFTFINDSSLILSTK